MRDLRATLARSARRPDTVLLVGETGTGKQLAAEAIHALSCPHEAFVAIDGCAPSLPASDLFGRARGASPGAVWNRPGALERAGRGTLFLDEIGRMPLAAQAMLPRVIGSRGYHRVGEDRERDFLARLVVATHRPLDELVAEGRFLPDLMYRVAVLIVNMPRLADHAEDVGAIILDWCARHGERPPDFTPSAVALIEEYSWPGNVRELHWVLRQILARPRPHPVAADDLRPLLHPSGVTKRLRFSSR